jgi:hypothetical protein
MAGPQARISRVEVTRAPRVLSRCVRVERILLRRGRTASVQATANRAVELRPPVEAAQLPPWEASMKGEKKKRKTAKGIRSPPRSACLQMLCSGSLK